MVGASAFKKKSDKVLVPNKISPFSQHFCLRTKGGVIWSAENPLDGGVIGGRAIGGVLAC